MKILVLNCGSSSVKFQLIDSKDDNVIAKGIVEKIGTSSAVLRYRSFDKNEIREVLEVNNHEYAIKLALNTLTDKNRGVIKNVNEISAIGHRVVHGGESFSGSVIITDEVVKEMENCSIFAPLHNPANLKGIEACTSIIPGVDQVGVFDTAFHQQIPQKAFLYGLPYAIYEKHKIRRYGFHGTSHWYVSKKAAQILNSDYNNLKVITCHLGNGASIAAVKNGVSIDTSMGFTPLEGLIMGTRCGDIDPAIIPYLMDKESLSSKEINNLMNKSSGLKGISKTSNDMREIEEEAESGSELHQLALEIFCYRIKKYIGSYSAALGGLDAVVFTGGIGENSPLVREKVCEGLDFLGIVLDKGKNSKNETSLSTGNTSILVIPTNEELAIAHETDRVLKEKHERELKEKEDLKITKELSGLTESDKAKIAIIWAEHKKLSNEKLLEIIKKDIGSKLSADSFERLLKLMGLS
ncbi:acetate/propionate family kinase [candidate division KSB1 bacterium]